VTWKNCFHPRILRLAYTLTRSPDVPGRQALEHRLIALLREGVTPVGPYCRVHLVETEWLDFAWVPPGSFVMGSPPGEQGREGQERQHRVTLTHGFWLGVTPVTQLQWWIVTGVRPGWFRGDPRPAQDVSWDDCQALCQALERQVSLRFRLPTEAEWEYACRAGTSTAYANGNDWARLDEIGWHNAEETRPVGQLQPNAFGLCDMHGNVWEWCADWYDLYPHKDVTDPRGPRFGEERILRGGSWSDGPLRCRSAVRWTSRFSVGAAGCRLILCRD
jgi:formylglycine-generating enzyme required for sulfatase activity